MSDSQPIHQVDRILALLVPDSRKRIAGVPIINPRSIPENQPLLIELIEAGFMKGRIENGTVQSMGVTWKGCDLYNACRGENVLVRLRFNCSDHMPLEQVYEIAVELHGLYSQQRVRRAKRYR